MAETLVTDSTMNQGNDFIRHCIGSAVSVAQRLDAFSAFWVLGLYLKHTRKKKTRPRASKIDKTGCTDQFLRRYEAAFR
jgi:hypothetical protein